MGHGISGAESLGGFGIGIGVGGGVVGCWKRFWGGRVEGMDGVLGGECRNGWKRGGWRVCVI